MELLWEAAGWTGAVSILGAYWAVTKGWLKAGRRFQAANLVGACAFVINGAFHEAWPSVATNIAWFLISAVALHRMGWMRTSSMTPPTPSLQSHIPSLPDTACQPAESELPATSIDEDVSDRLPRRGPK